MLRIRSLLALLAVALMFLPAACSSSSSSSDSTRANFAGTWDITLTVTTAGCPGTTIGARQTVSVTLTQTANGVVSDDDPDPQSRFTGTVNGLSVALTTADGKSANLTLPSASGTTVSGTYSETGAGGCVDVYSVSGTKQGGVGGTCTILSAGDWMFVLDVNGNSLDSKTIPMTGSGCSFSGTKTISTPPTTAMASLTLSASEVTGTYNSSTTILSNTVEIAVNLTGTATNATTMSGTFTGTASGGPFSGATSGTFSATRQ